MSNPFLTNIPWAGVTGITGASGATYATGANAWSGQLMNVQPAANFFTPSGPIAAENLNYMFNQRDNALIYVNASQGKQISGATGFTGPYKCVEDLFVSGGTIGIGGTESSRLVNYWAGNASFATGASVNLLSATIPTQVGDVMELEFVGAAGATFTGTVNFFDAVMVLGSFTSGASGPSWLVSAGSEWVAAPSYTGVGSVNSMPFSLKTRYTVVTGATGSFIAQLNGGEIVSGGGSMVSFGLQGGWSATLRHYSQY